MEQHLDAELWISIEVNWKSKSATSKLAEGTGAAARCALLKYTRKSYGSMIRQVTRRATPLAYTAVLGLSRVHCGAGPLSRTLPCGAERANSCSYVR